MNERKAVTKAIATRYARSDRSAKRIILDELCATAGWHRDHARKALRQSLVLRKVRPRSPRPPIYGEPVITALRPCWAVQGNPCGRLLAAALPDLVPRLRRHGELVIDDGRRGAAGADLPGHHRPAARGRPGKTRGPGPLTHEARVAVEGRHPDADVGRMERCEAPRYCRL
ncbi:hypothetical protein QFZ79_003397 [Arthrobacter sp. V4I6]|uniref:hypothetical protein n=1 Tax=unclassified Arthrobacter TaxID=235627 RepID=UPI002785A97C|nr:MULTISPECIES: hypothetical protein [unclassified Arthrobacter]MDQ0821025.1 hypothetical protein [Arthrobacter sp. V1I7]MDQ0855286.1 hypothetical protein [Arthrobacter sp. V4I6]